MKTKWFVAIILTIVVVTPAVAFVIHSIFRNTTVTALVSAVIAAVIFSFYVKKSEQEAKRK